MKLLSDRILVERIEKEENKTDSGIILSNKPKNDNQFRVVLIGPKVRHTKIRDIVQKMKYVPGTPIEYNGKMCLLLREGSELDLNI
ncbi:MULTISPECIES: co-chaperone GroES family protein [Flavobacterium]|uniref:Co-chaperone GroES family protein n=1 Tax=Flavobacterium keumense TaxID=1306518 RepID=A0ABY8N4M5_9FLAO|nr:MULTISPECIES: co-chaperone GroES family protein [Flavobacterium]WGK93811.1 co-chaperone GroES family protein [Flavobacterium keumense]